MKEFRLLILLFAFSYAHFRFRKTRRLNDLILFVLSLDKMPKKWGKAKVIQLTELYKALSSIEKKEFLSNLDEIR